jgi:acyl-coenzyme A thioesterase PaaI-like protein
MKHNAAPEHHNAAETWASLDHDNRDSALYADTSAAGVLLCRSCRALRRCRLGIRHETLAADGSVRSDVSCPTDQEGGPDVAHGGWTAGVLDEMSGHAVLLRNEFAVTGELTVRFVKPIPVERPLVGLTRITGRQGREVFVEGQLWLADANALVASSRAVMIRRPGNHFDRHQLWLNSLNDADGRAVD